MSHGYHQIELSPESRAKTAFSTFLGLFEYNRLAMGINLAAGTFAQIIIQCLQGMEGYTLSYLEDILIFSPTLESHLKHIELVLQRLREN